MDKNIVRIAKAICRVNWPLNGDINDFVNTNWDTYILDAFAAYDIMNQSTDTTVQIVETQDIINCDICAMRSSINGLWDNHKDSTHDQKTEIREIFIRLRELVLFNMDAEI